jgi:preprotein translocase subunit SecG
MILAAFWHPILATLFAFLALILMGVVLLQRGKGVGLAGAFGGAGGNTAFGAKTGDFLTWATIVIATIFLLYAVLLNFIFVPPQADLGTPAPRVAPMLPPQGQPASPGMPAQTESPPGDVEPPPSPAEQTPAQPPQP